jgi:Ca2+-binding EF-hand superfamily protein
MRLLAHLFLAAVVALLSACASSASRSERADLQRFESLDRDKDGYLSVSEALALPGLAARFQSADRDGDGRVSRAEFQQHLVPQSSVGGRN